MKVHDHSNAQVETPLLSVRELTVAHVEEDATTVLAADRVSFDLMRGRSLGIVGESGCGKSTTLRALIGLESPGKVIAGDIVLNGRSILGLPGKEMRSLRGSEIGMIFQDASTALNPVLTIGAQLREVLRVKRGLNRREARSESIALLERVGIPAAAHRVRDYPHQLSGGMRQRVMIALALAPRPTVLLADEPTTALDVTIQDQVLALLASLRQEEQMAMVLVSHDLGVIAQECDSIAVMYAGRVVEYGTVSEILDRPKHPYTRALISAMPAMRSHTDRAALPTIPGQPPELSNLAAGCSFAPRCGCATEVCSTASMVLVPAPPSHGNACILSDGGPS